MIEIIGGPGRTRTCNQTVMSGGATQVARNYQGNSSNRSNPRRAKARLFLVRNWCGSAVCNFQIPIVAEAPRCAPSGDPQRSPVRLPAKRRPAAIPRGHCRTMSADFQPAAVVSSPTSHRSN